MAIKSITISKGLVDRYHRRLSAMVKGGHDDLRDLRNRFGLALLGKGRVVIQDVWEADSYFDIA